MTLEQATHLRCLQEIARISGVKLAAQAAALDNVPFEIAHAILLPYCARREVARHADKS